MNLSVLRSLCLTLIAAFIFSCTENEEVEMTSFDQLPSLTCDTSYPSLGPNATPQTCSWSGTAINKGRLDCRTTSYGGYSESSPWGIYKVEGGTTRYNGTKTRVERFFNSVSKSNGKYTELTGTLRIVDLSDGETCIIQSHATGTIVLADNSSWLNKTNSSAQFLLYANRTSTGKVQLRTHQTDVPYTSSTTGHRDKKDFKVLDFGADYSFTYRTGYDSSGKQYSYLNVGGTTKTITHTHTTQKVYTRYGAYGTSDTGDKTAHIRFKNINLCRN